MKEYLTVEEVYDIICKSSELGTLGFFIGSGFSKAVAGDHAYNWKDLLRECCKKMNVDEGILEKNESLPEIASHICETYDKNPIDNMNGKKKIKHEISQLTDIPKATLSSGGSIPNNQINASILRYRDTLENIDINWVITTNYDTLLEKILYERAISLGPYENFTKINNLIPIYHMHGIRTIPESLIITNEDYVSLFRPNNYRQSRLPFLIKESTSVFLGYSLSDINVLTAVDWCKNVYVSENGFIENEMIQILWRKTGRRTRPYKLSGIIILEIDNILTFLEGLKEYYVKNKERIEEKIEKVKQLNQNFVLSEESDIRDFRDNTKRKEIIDQIAKLDSEFKFIYPSYVNFLTAVVQITNEKSEIRKNFKEYDIKLEILLDNLEYINVKDMPPFFIEYLVDSLNEVSVYIDLDIDKVMMYGTAWNASRIWNRRKDSIKWDAEELKKQIYSKKNTDLKRILGWK
jgi:hypothetical protein